MNDEILLSISDKLYRRFGLRQVICDKCGIGVNTLHHMVVTGNVTWVVLNRMAKVLGYHFELVKNE